MATLNPDEINALMSAIDEGRVAQEQSQGQAQNQGQVSVWDFTSQDRIIRGQLPTLDAINEQIASMLSIGLAGRTRINLSVSSRPASLQKFQDLTGVVAAPAVLCVLRLGPSRGPALCVFEPGTSESLLAAALGDREPKASELRPMPRTALTAVEQLVMKRLTTVLTDAVRVGWQEVLPMRPEILRYETDARMAAIMAPNDVAIVCAYEISGGIEGKIYMIIPYAAVEPVKAALLSPPRMSVGGDARFAEALADELTRVRVEVRGVLGKAAVSFDKMLNLNVGDLISLDADEKGSLPIYIQGREKLSGAPCVAGGSLALRVDHDIATYSRSDAPEHILH